MSMEKITLLAISSKVDVTYSVDFMFKDKRMYVFCNCLAGRVGKFCKHKISFLNGNDYFLADKTQFGQLEYVAEWAQKSEYLPYLIKLSNLENACKKAENNLKAMQEEIARAMKKGGERKDS